MSIKLNIGILFFGVFLWGEAVKAQLVPTKGLSPYGEYRQEILNPRPLTKVFGDHLK